MFVYFSRDILVGISRDEKVMRGSPTYGRVVKGRSRLALSGSWGHALALQEGKARRRVMCLDFIKYINIIYS